MDDNTTSSTNAAPPAARTAEALRELQERTRAALAAQRARMGSLEAQLTEQLDTIAGAVAEQLSSQSANVDLAQYSTSEADELRLELETAKATWNAEHERLAADMADRVKRLDERHTELDAQEAQLVSRRNEVEAQAAQFTAGRSEIELRQQTLDKRSTELNHRDRELRQRQEQLDSYATQFAAQQAQFTEAETRLQHDREAFAAQQAESTDTSLATADDLAARLAQAESELTTQQAAWEQELETSRAELKASRAATVERNELQQKFELAIEDMQRLRGRVTELEQELASRPAMDQTDSVELVHLRGERDALAERVAELERQSTAPSDVDAAQESADLQRRFELAVEDVRDLKKKNSQLESQLSEARSRPAAPASINESGGSSWELMKRQMLANLEDEVVDGEVMDVAREKERATIESTIRITDEVVANKDREIAELKARITEGGGHAAAAAEKEKVRELVDADEVIRQHREQIARLEHEMEGKLRAAELEISVERAKIARDQAQLADLRAEIDSQRVTGSGGNVVAGQPPKRRWMSKLGLGGDEA